MTILSLFKTVFNLGVTNVVLVLIYKLQLRFKLHPSQFIKINSHLKPIFKPNINKKKIIIPLQSWKKNMVFFGIIKGKITNNNINWFPGLKSKKKRSLIELNWWEISDFDSELGDIKKIWELSRIEWLFPFAQRINQGQKKELFTLNNWLNHWYLNNPPYKGPNWKCAQECSIRIMRIAVTSIILNNVQNLSSGLQNFLEIHLKRIALTINYSISQQNNHIISEGAALFIGGSWLQQLGHVQANKWVLLGRNIIEKQLNKLVTEKGGFSQYSLCYHRLFLETITLVEIWRKKLNKKRFSNLFYHKGKTSTNFLNSMINIENGRVPNIGANDGSYLLPLTSLDFNDYRPSLQVATIVFFQKRAFKKGLWDAQAKWLDVGIPKKLKSKNLNYICQESGFAVLSNKMSKVVMRFPNFKFRPGHSDIFHVDLWVKNKNILLDLGSYSYNKGDYWLDYFTSSKNHNTITFDNKDPMQRYSRFLFLDWVKFDEIKPISFNKKSNCFSSSYNIKKKIFHSRKIKLKNDMLIIRDNIYGTNVDAILNWNLNYENWKSENYREKNSCLVGKDGRY